MLSGLCTGANVWDFSHVNCFGGVGDGKVNVETHVQYLVIVTKPQPVVFLSLHD
jgi:hypothetical protein